MRDTLLACGMADHAPSSMHTAFCARPASLSAAARASKQKRVADVAPAGGLLLAEATRGLQARSGRHRRFADTDRGDDVVRTIGELAQSRCDVACVDRGDEQILSLLRARVP